MKDRVKFNIDLVANIWFIINTISRNAETDVPTTSAYAAAKAGIWSASRVAAKEVADSDILINMLIGKNYIICKIQNF